MRVCEALYMKYGPMRALLNKADELTSQIDALEARIDRRIAEINVLLDEIVDYPISEKDGKDFDDQNKADVEEREAEIRVLVDQRMVLGRRIYEYEVARRSVLGLPELPKPQQ
jgi:PAS domain-containing protein